MAALSVNWEAAWCHFDKTLIGSTASFLHPANTSKHTDTLLKITFLCRAGMVPLTLTLTLTQWHLWGNYTEKLCNFRAATWKMWGPFFRLFFVTVYLLPCMCVSPCVAPLLLWAGAWLYQLNELVSCLTAARPYLLCLSTSHFASSFWPPTDKVEETTGELYWEGEG